MDESKRARDRNDKRSSAKEGVRVWPSGLLTNRSKMIALAEREWNFERFYEKVKRFGGGSVSREVLKEFMAAHGIELKQRPKGSGRVF